MTSLSRILSVRWLPLVLAAAIGCGGGEQQSVQPDAPSGDARAEGDARGEVVGAKPEEDDTPPRPSEVADPGRDEDGEEVAKPGPPAAVRQSGTIHFETTTPRLPQHAAGVCGVAFSPDGLQVATIDVEYGAKVTDLRTGDVVRELPVGEKDPERFLGPHLRDVAYSPDGRFLAVATGDVTRLFDTSDWTLKQTLENEMVDEIDQVAFDPEGKQVVARGQSGCATWRTDDGQLVNAFEYPHTTLDHAGITSDGRAVLAKTQDRKGFDLIEVATGKTVQTFADTGYVSSVAFSPDGRTLATAGGEYGFVLWDVETGERSLQARDGEDVSALAFSPDGRLLAVGFYEIDLVRLTDDGVEELGSVDVTGPSAAGQIVFSRDGTRMAATDQNHHLRADLSTIEWTREEAIIARLDPKWHPLGLVHGGDQLVTRSDDALRWVSIETGAVERSIAIDSLPYSRQRYTFSRDGRWVAITDDESLRLRDVENEKSAGEWTPEGVAVAFPMFTPDGGKILVGDRLELNAHHWDVATRKPVPSEPAVRGEEFVFTADGKEVFAYSTSTSFGADDHVRRYEWPSGRLLADWKSSEDRYLLPVEAGDRCLLYGRKPKRFQTRNASSGEVLREFETEENIAWIDVSGDGRWAVVAHSDDPRIGIWSTETGRLRALVPAHRKATAFVGFLPDGRTFATLGDYADPTFKRWDLERLLEEVPEPPDEPETEMPPTGALARIEFGGGGREFQLSPDSRLLGTRDGRIHDTATGEVVSEIDVGDGVNGFAISPDGRWFATSHGNDLEALEKENAVPGKVRVRDARTGRIEHELVMNSSVPEGLAFSPDGKRLVTGSGNVGIDAEGSDVAVWDVTTGERVRAIPLENRRVTHVVHSPDGRFVALAAFGPGITIWDTAEEKVIETRDFSGRVDDLSISPDGVWVAACEAGFGQGRAIAWNVRTGETAAFLDDFREAVHSIAVSPDGRLIATDSSADRERWFRVWDRETGRELRRFRHNESSNGTVRFDANGRLYVAAAGVLAYDVDELLDLDWQRQLELLRKQEVYPWFEDGLPSIDLDDVTDAALAELPEFARPVRLRVTFSDGLTDAGLAALARQPHLAEIHLTYLENVTDAGIAHLGNAAGLRGVSLESLEKVTPACLRTIGAIDELARLKVDGLELHDADLAAIAGCRKLRHLGLSGFELTGAALGHLEEMHELESLVLGFVELDDDSLQSLSKMTKLKRLVVAGSGNLTGTGLRYLAGSQDIAELDFTGSGITDEGLNEILAFPKLRQLTLNDTAVTTAGYAALAGSRELEELHLGPIDDTGLGHLAGLTKLRWLYFAGERDVTDAGLAKLAELKALEAIDLGEMPGVVGPGLAALTGAPRLERLDLGSTGVTDEGLAHLVPMPQLRVLSLPEGITDAAIPHLERLTGLETLHLRGEKTTEAGRERLQKALPNLYISLP